MKNKINCLIIVILFLPLSLLSQDKLSQYFDDGGVAEASRLVKIGYDPINGEIPIIYEHRLTKHISAEWGIGLVSLKRQSKLYDDIDDSGIGLNMWVNMRIYLSGYYERFYMGFQPRLSFLAGKKYTDIVFFNCGYQRPITGRLVYDVNFGLGVRSYKEDPVVIGNVEYDYGRTSSFFIPLQLKLAYSF